ncbi:hypothetical protein Tco_0020197 [Tanacetum coccineum]
MFRIASTTTQNRTPQLPHASRNTNPHMSKSSGVIHRMEMVIAKKMSISLYMDTKAARPKKIWMPKIRKDDESTSISPTIDIVSRITNIVQLILFIVDSGCTKHMTGNLKLLCNSVEKFLATVRFGNGQCIKTFDRNRSSLGLHVMTFEHSSSSLGHQFQASVFIGMMSVHISSGLVLHQMTSDHNRSELGIQDHSNEQSSSKLVPKVVP